MRRVPILALIAAMMLGLFSTTFSSPAGAVGPLEWKGQTWEVTGPATATSPGNDAVLTRMGAGEVQLHVDRVLDGGNPTLAAATTPWVSFSYIDDGSSQGIDMFVAHEEHSKNFRLSGGSLFTSCDGIGYSRMGGLPGLAPTTEQVDFAQCKAAPDTRTVGAAHTVYVGQRADGTIDWNFDGKPYTSTYLKDNAPAGERFSFSDIYLRWRSQAQTGSVKFTDFQWGTHHVPVAPNPDLQGGCGLNFVLVLDRSGSVAPSQDKVKGAANAFLDSLTDTGSSVSLVSFAETARVDQTPIPLTSPTNRALLRAKIGEFRFEGFTNWDDALVKAKSQLPAFDGPNKPLVVMITDGNPNRWGAAGDTHGSGSGFVQEAQDQAAEKANAIKGEGSHMFALGISGGTDPLRTSALRAISGHDEYPNADLSFGQTDWTQVQNFDELGGMLDDIASDLCGGTVIAQKFVNGQAAGGWDFAATNATDSPGKTGDDGFVSFKLESGHDDVTTRLTEQQQAGYGLMNVDCKEGDSNDSVGTRLTDGDGVSLTVGPRDTIRCRFDNVVLPAAIALAKSVDHPTVRSGATVVYTYSVTNPKPVPLSDVAVTDDKCSPLVFVSGDDGDKVLQSTETWIYTCSMAITEDTTNIATATGKTPLGIDVIPFHATAVVDVIGPAMTLVKNAPAMAHNGDVVTYGFTVTNTGDTALENITVTDDKLGTIGTVASLAPGASATLNKDYTVLADQIPDVVNQASACAAGATDRVGQPLCAQGQHTLDVLHPAITIDKTANPINVTVPNAVTFTYVVKNTGDTPLSGLAVTDDRLGIINNGAISAGETQTFTKTINVSATTPARNIGTATGVDPLGRSVTASDPADIAVTEVLGVQLTQPNVLPITGAGLRNLLVGVGVLLMGGLLLMTARRRRTA
jgi:uncharacterized repeat protein (TIGR01451 family)